MIYITTDTEITKIAAAIRRKGGTSEGLLYPNGMVSAINAIPSSLGPSLSFTVVGGTIQPAYPTDNMIWANTANTITSVVLANINDEPNNPTEGMLWIGTSMASHVEMTIYDNPEIKIYPWRAKQYVSGAWTDVTCKSYLDGEWKNWSLTLFTVGDPIPTITGSGGTVELLDSGALRFASSVEYAINRYLAVDLTDYSTLYFRGIGQRSGTTTDEQVGICSTSSIDYILSASPYPATNLDGMTTDRTFDVRSYIGAYRIRFYAYQGLRHIDMFHLELIP